MTSGKSWDLGFVRRHYDQNRRLLETLNAVDRDYYYLNHKNS
jgi:hypothetical protein